ncbi:hypothetical protein K0U91_02345 [Chryseobacterium chendengshani]|uniref:hypothetical protein n=1 Tax=Chryseobacterium sp. LJ668 TaxID=2864040 RepID=UPI001C691C8A|nr:hypothetical protein [Chryseobacterium sp. LJ668]MBW8524059.1 hypothetical protein [Chryseobacterium sp. LJ668]QYK16994.1 hypothetical protein K0U91_02345 [Chryseobacterium sp. LJ668]
MHGNFLNIVLVIFLNSCTSMPKFYEGYIFNKDKKPLSNIKVCENNKSNCVYTDSKGYFRLEKQRNSINDLIVFSKSTPVDTIKTVWSQHGEKINYSFVEGKKDTLFLNIK